MTMKFSILAVLWLALVGGQEGGSLIRSSQIVSTQYGSLRGLILKPAHSSLGRVAVFLGVPYAAPPVGHLRFMPPMSAIRWEGIRKVDTLPPVCPQKLPDVTNRREALRRMSEGRFNYLQRLLPLLSNQSENCLYLNIYAPIIEDRDMSQRSSVLVYIHGESYEWNSGNPYDGSVLASYGKVVVVTVNFRLGVLGFLRPALRKSQLSNFGLLDQIAALHWVKENIADFGGDPGSVTIFGHGTGAALANLLLVSPVAQASKGLFHRAILMSGSALSRWAMTWDPHKYTIQIAEAVNCPTSDRGDELVNCLRQKSVEELLDVKLKTPAFTTPLGPIVDNVIVSKNPLISMSVDTAVFGKYDLLYGVALAESYHMLNSVEVKRGMSTERRNLLIRAYISNNFDHHGLQIYAAVRYQYTPSNSQPADGNQSDQMVRDQTLEILSDAQIVAPVVKMGRLHSDINPRSFFYCFNHQSTYGDYPVNQGTVHGEELPYIFGAPLVGGFNHFGINYTYEEILLSELVMTQWTNFAKTGTPNLPTPQNYTTRGADHNWITNLKTMWPSYEKQIQRYLHIDMQVVSKDHYRALKMRLWNHLIPDLTSSTRTDPDFTIPTVTDTNITFVPEPPIVIPSGERTTFSPTMPKSKPPRKPVVYKTPPIDVPLSPTEAPSPPPPPSYAGTPISIVILVGVAILFINCCAMGVVYYQRDKIKYQSNLLKRTFFSRKTTTEDSEERISDAPSSSAMKERKHRKRESKSDYEVSDELHSESGSKASGVSRDSSMRRKHSASTQDSSSKQETPKGSLKSKSPKPGHKRHKSETSIYSEISRMAEVHVHAEASGPLKSSLRKNPTVKFNTLGGGLPPKSVTKSTTSISSKVSIRSNTSRASVKSVTSRSSIKSTKSEKSLRKNASCQSLPTAEYTWGITPEMTMAQRDDPEGRDDQRTPADRQQTLAAMQKLNCPKVLPDHPDGVHAATLPKMRPPPPPRSTSLTAKDLQEIEDNVHVVYRKKRTHRRDASTDSCDLSGVENIYGMGTEAVPTTSMYGSPAPTATVSRTRSRKSDGAADYGRTGPATEYVRPAKSADYGRHIAAADYGRTGPSGSAYPNQGGGTTYSGYMPYEPSYAYKEGSAPSSPRTPTTPTAADENKTFVTYSGGLRAPRGPLATFGKTGSHSPTENIQQDPLRSRPVNDSTIPNTSAVVTAAAQTAFATVTAPAFVGATNPSRSAAPRTTPSVALNQSTAIQQQESTASSSDTATVYEQSENTGTIKRKKSVKKENSVKTVVIQEPTDKSYDKPLKGVLKQTSAYDKPKPTMAKAPGASPSASASSLSSATSTEVGSGASGNSGASGSGASVNSEAAARGVPQKSLKYNNARPATPGTKHKTRQDNHTSTAVTQTKLPE